MTLMAWRQEGYGFDGSGKVSFLARSGIVKNVPDGLMRYKSVGSRKKVRKITHTNGISKGEVGQVL